MNTINILHFPSGVFLREEYQEIIKKYAKQNIQIEKDLTILTMFTNYDQAILCKQLDFNKIPYINVLDSVILDQFLHQEKTQYYLKALEQVKTKYVLIIDSYDTVICTFEDMLKKFISLNCDILYNASSVEYPYGINEQQKYNAQNEYFNQLNSGVCLGYTNKLISFYKEILNTIKKLKKEFPQPDQYFVRNAVKNTNLNIQIDSKTQLFWCGLNAKIIYTPDGILFGKNPYKIEPQAFEGLEYNNFTVDPESTRILVGLCQHAENILDLGAGNTTKIFNYFNKNCVSIDDNEHYIKTTLAEYQVHICQSEINNEYSYYKNLIPIIRNTKFDLVCVDGPFGFISKFPRQNILEIIDNRLLNEQFFIFIHDSDRKGEQNLITQIKEHLQNNQYKYSIDNLTSKSFLFYNQN